MGHMHVGCRLRLLCPSSDRLGSDFVGQDLQLLQVHDSALETIACRKRHVRILHWGPAQTLNMAVIARPARPRALLACVATTVIFIIIIILRSRSPQESSTEKRPFAHPSLDKTSGDQSFLEEPHDTPSERSYSSAIGSYSGAVMLAGRDAPSRSTGSLDATIMLPSGTATPTTLPITEGLWHLQAPESATLEIYHGVLDGLVVWPVEHSLKLSSSGPRTIVLSTQPSIWIVDRDSQVLLTPITVICMKKPGGPRHRGVKPHSGLVGKATGIEIDAPVASKRLEAPCAYLVTARDHTWGLLPVTRPEATSALVQLDPAGSLEVDIKSGLNELSDKSVLRLAVQGHRESQPAYEIQLESGQSRFFLDKIAIGQYDLAIVRSPRTAAEATLSRTDTSIQRGTTSTVELSLSRSPPDITPTTTSIIISGDNQTIERFISATVIPMRGQSLGRNDRLVIGKQNIVAMGEDQIVLDPVELLPGTYSVHIQPFGRIEILSIPRAPAHSCEIALGGVRDYEIVVLDDQTGQPVEVQWCMAWSAGGASSESLSASPIDGGARCTLGNPIAVALSPGKIKLALTAKGFDLTYVYCDGTVESALVVRLAAQPKVQLRLVSRGNPTLAPNEWWTGLSLRRPSGQAVPFFLEFQGSPIADWQASVVMRSSESDLLILEAPNYLGSRKAFSLQLELVQEFAVRAIDVDQGAWADQM